MDHVIVVDNETSAEYCRITKEGKKLTYKLTVLQQPEKARACGSGAKSSADRRPVDPPPIVELKIYEGEGANNDITFTMNANYFLYATLEQARPIAQGRVPQDGKATVLTGTPVSGLVYLDRPHPAGYFLFPDLSVRHEGKYRLSFNLYEELKEDKDEDKVTIKDEAEAHTGGHVTHRLEVKSRPFIVYSAKKFPGLNQSTELSRTVAEQGCRVRIRRDARVRKRGKHGQDIDGCSEGPAGEMYTAPAGERSQMPHRQRSSSVESHRSIAPAISRRSSEQGHSYPQGGHQGHQPQSAAPPGAYGAPYGQSPAANYPPTYYHGPSYPHSAMPPPQHIRQPSYPHSYYQQPMQQPSAPTHSHHGSISHPVTPVADGHYQFGRSMAEARPGTDYHSTAGTGPVPPYHYHSAPPHPQSQQGPPAPHPSTEPSYQHEPSKNGAPAYGAPYHQGSIASHRMLPALNTGNQIPSRLLEPSSPSSCGPSPVYSEGPRLFKPFGGPENGTAPNGKRSYGQVFDTHHMDGPMRSGARPTAGVVVGHASALRVDPDEAAEDMPPVGLRMSYKRADGRQITKSLPYDH